CGVPQAVSETVLGYRTADDEISRGSCGDSPTATVCPARTTWTLAADRSMATAVARPYGSWWPSTSTCTCSEPGRTDQTAACCTTNQTSSPSPGNRKSQWRAVPNCHGRP